ncbi:hypothetical protein HCH_03518 [Hahella chejuensis KCTC 2396]|uniref:Uncharacterized protein n=1 Tax=Hahella chejuensis (strain KCTC 2396) TaxID=349521 RepID=Q2SGG1_HAHCH|nr:hypothetical protein [Hahella chejuensis]ABC30263.1 hypothetical protein HCH_03518 [Hahella chejuensis KCTC 2396]
MEIVSAWLLYHRASMDPFSPMNLDGSEYMVGVGVVPATSMREALDLFDKYLAESKMTLMDLWKCEQYKGPIGIGGPIHEPSLNEPELGVTASQALENDCIYYVGGISSEALEYGEELGHEEG